MCPRRGGRGWLLSKSASQGTAQVAGLARSLPPSCRLLGAGLRLVGGVGYLCRISGPRLPKSGPVRPRSAWASLSIFSLLPTPPSVCVSVCACVCARACVRASLSLPLTLSVIIPFHPPVHPNGYSFGDQACPAVSKPSQCVHLQRRSCFPAASSPGSFSQPWPGLESLLVACWSCSAAL